MSKASLRCVVSLIGFRESSRNRVRIGEMLDANFENSRYGCVSREVAAVERIIGPPSLCRLTVVASHQFVMDYDGLEWPGQPGPSLDEGRDCRIVWSGS